MSSKTKVSKQVKVTQGPSTITFELAPRGLTVTYADDVAPDTRFTLGKPGMDALRELLGLQQPSQQPRKAEKPVVSLEEAAKRFTREGDTPSAPDRPMTEEEIEDSGLTRSADKTESGMD